MQDAGKDEEKLVIITNIISSESEFLVSFNIIIIFLPTSLLKCVYFSHALA